MAKTAKTTKKQRVMRTNTLVPVFLDNTRTLFATYGTRDAENVYLTLSVG